MRARQRGPVATAGVAGGLRRTLRSERTRRLVFAVGPSLVAAGFGGFAARGAPETYGALRKPGWAPPAGAFGPVWTGLYATIAAAGWHMHPRAGHAEKVLHLTQMAMNTAWPAVFFAARSKPPSVALISALDVALCAELALLRRSDRTAAVLLVPYLSWSLFATGLNVSVSAPA